MLDPGLLLKPLKETGVPELPVNDPRLQELSARMAKGDYRKAGEQAEALFRGGIYDLRPLGGYLMALFLEQGFAGLACGLEAAAMVVGPHWERFGPRRRPDKALDTALTWFGQTLHKMVAHHEAQKDATWQGWLDPGNLEPALLAFEQLGELIEALEERVPNAKARGPLSELGRWLNALSELLMERFDPEAGEAGADEGEEEGPEAEAAAGENLPVPVRREERKGVQRSPGAAAWGPGMETLTIQVSPALGQLLRQIAAFERLVERGRLERAAIVAADVQETLEHFDPHIMLPGVIAPFVRALATRIEEIEPLLESRDGLMWRTLNQLYHVDLEGFAEG